MKNLNKKKRVSIAGFIGVIVMSVLLVLSACSQDSNLFGHKKTEEASHGNFLGWLEYERADQDIQIVRVMYYTMPNMDKLLDAYNFHNIFRPVHTPDGAFRAYYYRGPFKSVLAVKGNMKMGKLNGTVTFWDERGKLFRQQVFQEDMLVESRGEAPWLDNETNQTLPDGVYTFFETERLDYLLHSPSTTVRSQEIYSGGQKVNSIATYGEWQPIEEGLWKCIPDRLVCIPIGSGNDYFLNRRKVVDGATLLIQGDTNPVVFHIDKKFGDAQFTDSKGRELNVNINNATFSWPENDKQNK